MIFHVCLGIFIYICGQEAFRRQVNEKYIWQIAGWIVDKTLMNMRMMIFYLSLN